MIFVLSRMANDELNMKVRRYPSMMMTTTDIISNPNRTSTPVDSFVQLNLTRETPPIDIKLEDYKKVKSIVFVFVVLSLSFVLCVR
jgi:hypothetical protein